MQFEPFPVHRLVWLIGAVLMLALSQAALAVPVLYGGLGGHNIDSGPAASANDGALVLVSQTNASTSLVGHPAGVARISGLAFGLDGTLFGATQAAGGFPPPPGPTSPSDLIRINPNTGALISSTPITAGGVAISIADLATQPGTGALYGIRSPLDKLNGQGKLYTINAATGHATLVGDTGDFFGSIAFGPTGTLYLTSADLGPQGAEINRALKTLDPSNAATLSVVPLADFFGALAVRPSDGAIFGGTGDQHQLFTIDPATGAETLIGDTGLNFIGDLAFRAPEPPTIALLALALLFVVPVRRR